MSEEKRTIQEALAEVQRNAELKRIKENKTVWENAQDIEEGKETILKTISKGADTVADWLSKKAHGTPRVTVRPQGTVSSAPKPAQTAKPALPPKAPEAPSTARKVAGNIASGGASVAAGAALGAMVAGSGKEEKPMSSISPAPQSSISPVPKPKQDDMTFGQAFKKAREMSSGKSTGQFTWHGKEYQTNIQGKGSATKPQEKYIAPKLQSKTGLDVPKPAAASSDAPKPSLTSAAAPAPSTDSSQTMVKSGETISTRPSFPLSMKTSTEDGKKKKMSEETNPLIAAFLKLQTENPSNMFEAAKKAKKDYDKDGKVESPKDEVWGSRFRAAKAAGKMEEGMIDPKDPSVQGGGDVTSTPEKPTKPVAPKKIDRDPSYQGSGEVTKSGKPASVREDEQIDEVSAGLARRAAHHAFVKSDKMKADAKKEPDMHSYVQAFHKGENKSKQGVKFANYAAKKMKEEVEFSQAEIDHINSFFEAVAPNRPEPTKGVNPTVSNTSLTDETIEEGRPKKNPEPASTDRDPRKHIQVEAGRAAAGSVVDFHHNDGSKSKITPAMGRRITSHLQGLKPAERQAAVNKMHASAEGLKV